MKFCSKCGSMMKTHDGGFVCSCGHKESGKIEFREVKSQKKPSASQPPLITESDTKGSQESKDTMPIVDKACPSCGNPKAYWWERQTRAADEPETQFFRCTKCNHTWRKY